MSYKKWKNTLVVSLIALLTSSGTPLQASCKSCEKQPSKIYINQQDLEIENGKIWVKVNGKSYNTPAVFSDQKGIFIPLTFIADNGEEKKAKKPCRPPSWECKKCHNCNEYWAYWCSSCATPISAQ